MIFLFADGRGDAGEEAPEGPEAETWEGLDAETAEETAMEMAMEMEERKEAEMEVRMGEAASLFQGRDVPIHAILFNSPDEGGILAELSLMSGGKVVLAGEDPGEVPRFLSQMIRGGI